MIKKNMVGIPSPKGTHHLRNLSSPVSNLLVRNDLYCFQTSLLDRQAIWGTTKCIQQTVQLFKALGFWGKWRILWGSPFPEIAAIYSRHSHASWKIQKKFEVSHRLQKWHIGSTPKRRWFLAFLVGKTYESKKSPWLQGPRNTPINHVDKIPQWQEVKSKHPGSQNQRMFGGIRVWTFWGICHLKGQHLAWGKGKPYSRLPKNQPGKHKLEEAMPREKLRPWDDLWVSYCKTVQELATC